MVAWNGNEILSCVAYGTLWLVYRMVGDTAHCVRLRKKKENLYVATERIGFKIAEEIAVGYLLFEDRNKVLQRLVPQGELANAVNAIIPEVLELYEK